MKRLVVIVLLLLSGCATKLAPVSMTWPAAPEELFAPVDELTPLAEDKKTLADMIQNANENYSKYYLLKDRYQAWQDWYKSQKKINEDAAK
jgi:hypothetical protein